jgi:acyl carrier protein
MSITVANGGTSVRRRVNTTILKTLRKLKEDRLTDTADLIADLGADSLDKVTIIFELEEEFGIQIEDTEEAAVVTVRDLVALIERKTAQKAGAQ